MRIYSSQLLLWATISLHLFSSEARAAGKPEDEAAAIIKLVLGKSFVLDWQGIEKIGQVQWTPLPPTMLQNCLPDGGCFTRQGKAVIAGRNLVFMATGARSIVSNLYIRNMSAPFGEAAILAALKEAALTADLARCPVPGTPGGTNWYRLKSAAANPGILSIQSSCSGRPCEGLALTPGEQLPQLQPAQLRMYSEQCSAPPAERTAISTVMPVEQLAQTIAAMLPPATGPALYDWKAFMALQTGIEWNPGGPKKGSLTFKNDPNPFMHSGRIAMSGRQFSAMLSGSPAEVKAAYLDEGGMHPRGEHMLGVLYKQGYQVRLVRCGPVYTESTNNWYSVTSAKTRPVMLQQSIRYEGNQVQDSYALRLDGTLPARDPRDRDPGAGGCR
jgi:hypothetical protein